MTDDTKDTKDVPALPEKIDFSALKKAGSALKRITESNRGASFLKFHKGGYWIYGSEDQQTESEALWAVNTPTLKNGWICWPKVGSGKPLGEEMNSALFDDPIVKADLPYYTEGEWAAQFSVQLMCLEGVDKGKEVLYAASSHGGRKAIDDLITQLIDLGKISVEEEVPAVLLSKYKQKTKHGVQDWPLLNFERMIPQDEAATMLEAGDTPPEPEAKLPARTRRRR